MPNNFGIYLQEHIVQDPNAMGKQRSGGKGRSLVDSMCFEPWLSVAITAEGVVGPCCAFWDPNAESIQKVSFREAWLGPYMQDMRKRLVENRLPGYCSRCPSILFALSEVLRAQLRWELMAPHERALYLVHKATNSIGRYGFRRALRRGVDWARIHARGR